MKYKRNSLVAVTLMMSISTMNLMGGVIPYGKKFYVVPLHTTSFKFDTVDLVSGSMKETVIDFGMDG